MNWVLTEIGDVNKCVVYPFIHIHGEIDRNIISIHFVMPHDFHVKTQKYDLFRKSNGCHFERIV